MNLSLRNHICGIIDPMYLMDEHINALVKGDQYLGGISFVGALAA
jgi:hypothetical protein